MNNMMGNNNFNSFNMSLDNFGAPGYNFQERLDFSGHASGNVLPHINSEVIGPCGKVGITRDLTNTQIPGMNNII